MDSTQKHTKLQKLKSDWAEATKLVRIAELFGFNVRFLGQNLCFTFCLIWLSGVASVGWINNFPEKYKKLIISRNLSTFHENIPSIKITKSWKLLIWVIFDHLAPFATRLFDLDVIFKAKTTTLGSLLRPPKTYFVAGGPLQLAIFRNREIKL